MGGRRCSWPECGRSCPYYADSYSGLVECACSFLSCSPSGSVERQATRGDCTLMRRFGREAGLPPPEPPEAPEDAKKLEAEALVDIIRHSRDPQERDKALLELEKLGMVESL